MPPAEPFGYFKDDNGVKQPIESQLAAIEQAQFYIDSGCSLTHVRHWLVEKTGRSISIPGLIKTLKFHAKSKKNSKD